MTSPALEAEAKSLGRSESEARRDKAFDAMREALQGLIEMAEVWADLEGHNFMQLEHSDACKAARAALALAEKAKP